MSEEENDQIYEVEVTYQDAGMSLEFPMDQWRNRIEDDFGSFSDIKDFYRTDLEDLEEAMSEHGEEIEEDESRDGPGIVFLNPPKEWKEDFGEAAPFLRIAEEQMVRVGLFSLVEDEVEAQRKLLESAQYKPLIIRQSAFLEKFLELKTQLAFQTQKGESLSNKEMDVIENMGHTDRIRLAHLFGVVDEAEHGHLQSMASLRNDLAHAPWGEFTEDEESLIKTTANKVFGLLEARINQAYESLEEDDFTPTNDDFEIGFDGLDVDTQLLQLGILDVIRSKGGTDVPVHEVAAVLPRDLEVVKQRCLRMDHIGYLDLDKDQLLVSIRQKGRELLDEEL